MPSQRKRIGFLPRTEVQKIIDKICNHNKLSQSKVTGILVEEALNSRGLLNRHLDNNSMEIVMNNKDSLLPNNDCFNVKTEKSQDNIISDTLSLNDEIQMINDFIEFKFFKNIMNKKRHLSDN